MKIIKEALPLGRTPMGDMLNIWKYTLDSEKEGQAVYLQSGIHGGEITQWIMHDLFNYLKQNLKRGKVILIPSANPVSWLQRNYFSTNGKFDFYMGKDWNRHFPGSKDGSLGERISAILFEVAQYADFVLDLHTSRHSLPFSIAFSRDMEEYVRLLGLEYNQIIDAQKNIGYANTINASLYQKKVPSLCIECGSHDAYEPENLVLVEKGIERILKHFDLIDEAIDAGIEADKQKIFSKTVTYRAENGGLIHLAKSLGDKVCQGDVLYYFYDNQELGDVQPYLAKHSGILFKISPTHIYWPGDEIVQLILDV